MITLKLIKPKRISDQVFEQLKELIFKGQLKPGDQLMTERELAQSMGVSRPTVREALNKLVAMGLLEHRQGQGTFVNSPADDADKNPLAAVINGHDVSLQDLLEVRLGLECNAVALAARRATEEDLQELIKSLAQMIEEIKSGKEGLGSNADLSFHMAIAYATRNLVQIHIMRSFYDLLFFGIKENLQHLYSDPSNLDRVIEQHESIVEAIRKRDPEAATAAMRKHITFVIDFFRERERE
ncbi:FadR/GntR family transcriptional regulator [Desulforhabdus sp. TSK]|uniref:FadR/GntR family transcriptional regulator n=1 Tax=Desulforhabdus sp. TSK TaxID=2925014 RepID=UPI001FC85B11|nr:FadR/GntR family transcriptional regulator [Desulforhabdus sp. TSK]GKT10629.1 GntR family transcriptional regulator [Desulforhabdus sp. TSK]